MMTNQHGAGRSARGCVLGLLAALLAAAAPAGAAAQFGGRMADVRGTDLFTFFSLERVDSAAAAGGGARVSFRPSGEAFRSLAEVRLVMDAAGIVRTAELSLARAFVDHARNGFFARDLGRSFLAAFTPADDVPDLRPLADAIAAGGASGGVRGYAVWRGEEEEWSRVLEATLVEMRNVRAPSPALVLRLTAR